MNKDNTQTNDKYGDKRYNISDFKKDVWVNGFVNSYAHVSKGGHQAVNEETESTPALVLDETCLNQ